MSEILERSLERAEDRMRTCLAWVQSARENLAEATQALEEAEDEEHDVRDALTLLRESRLAKIR